MVNMVELIFMLLLMWISIGTIDSLTIDIDETERLLISSFPLSIPVFSVRTYPRSSNGVKVTRDRFQVLGGFPDRKNRSYSLQEFKNILQCTEFEPSFDDLYGSVSIMKLYPLTREGLEGILAWVEKRFGSKSDRLEELMREMKVQAQSYKEGNYPNKFGMYEYDLFYSFRLFRVIKGDLHYDWPWGIDRIIKLRSLSWLHRPLIYVLNVVNDMGDSVFGLGGEFPFIPMFLNFPLFAQAGSKPDTNTLLWPWEQEFKAEFELFMKIRDTKNNYTDDVRRTVYNGLSWAEKRPKAAYFGSRNRYRAFLEILSAENPDLVESNYYYNLSNVDEKASRKPRSVNVKYHPGHYKYVVVPPGISVRSTSARLLHLLAHCECVILYMETHLQYHITPRLRPWVHYVPLSSSGADLIVKLKWLMTNDNLAQRIAQNGYNFGKSYLRLEDYICYAATALQTVALLQKGSSALIPWTPVNISDLPIGGAVGYGGYRHV